MSNPFASLSVGQLSALQTAYLDCVTALAANQSYSLNGRSLTRASLPQVTQTLGQINAALAIANGTSTTVSYVSFTGS